VGLLPHRRVRVLRHVAIGKESNAISLQAAEESDGVLGGREAGIDTAQAFDHGSLQKTLSSWSVADLARDGPTALDDSGSAERADRSTTSIDSVGAA